MSTRATYSFKSKDKPTVTYYIHHDGYPEYAFNYFNNMHHATCKGDDYAQRFCIGNPNQAELTESHDAHGDTEYKYTLHDDGILIAEKRNYNENWRQFFIGSYALFINQYMPACYGEEYRPDSMQIHKVLIGSHEELLTVKQIMEMGIRAYKQTYRFKQDNPNHQYYKKRAMELLDLANRLHQDDKFIGKDIWNKRMYG